MSKGARFTLLILSIALALLVVVISCAGLFSPDFYYRETPNWQAQSLGQDFMDLVLVVPVLIIATGGLSGNSRPFALIWLGTVLYLLYTFLIYSFDVHFNSLFLAYCLALGLCFYAVVYFFRSSFSSLMSIHHLQGPLAKFTALYFVVIASVFYALWLLEIIPAILSGAIPPALAEVGLPTNAVHVIDLSVVLPGIFITGVLMLKKNPLGFLLAPAVLTFFILMDITIGGLMVFMHQRELQASLEVASVMGLLAIFSAILLYLNLKKIEFSQPVS